MKLKIHDPDQPKPVLTDAELARAETLAIAERSIGKEAVAKFDLCLEMGKNDKRRKSVRKRLEQEAKAK